MEKKLIETETCLYKRELFVKEFPVSNVTVYIDRAEVSRDIEVELNVGNVEVLAKDLPSTIDPDSVRVSCYGKATIVEVAYQTKAINEDNSEELAAKKTKTEEEIKRMSSELNALSKEKERIAVRVQVIEKEKKILDSYADCVSSSKEDKVSEIMEKKSIENMLSFLTIYQERSDKLTDEQTEMQEKIEEIDKSMEVLNTNLAKLKPKKEKVNMERNVSILLDVQNDGTVKLVLSYVVSNASWSPLYDIRAFNKDSSVQILYFANIKQNTGEDWENAKLYLSTAIPSIGGSPPQLTPVILQPQGYSYRHATRGLREDLKLKSSLATTGLFGSSDVEEDEEQIEALFPQAKVVESITSTTFEIMRLATIESDNVGHKVSICQLDFSPSFEYMAIPKTVAHAFLKIRVKNESAYALLAGGANVFLDNNFLTKSSLPAVSPLEEFEMSLGVDPSVKITYKPLKKFKQTTGMISKSDVFNHFQQIEVKNTKTSPIKITVIDQCPRSGNDKIKVLLEEPEVRLSRKGSNAEAVIKVGNATFYTSDYKIEWLLEVPPSETKTINLKYQIEHPVGMDIEIENKKTLY